MLTKEKLKQEIDLLANSRPIHYPESETLNGVAFTDIEDAATFGKQLRAGSI